MQSSKLNVSRSRETPSHMAFLALRAKELGRIEQQMDLPLPARPSPHRQSGINVVREFISENECHSRAYS